MIGMAARWTCLPISAAVFLAFFAATEGAAAEQRHGAHVHGVSRLAIAVEADGIELGLEAPGADIVGFEHVARSAEDKAAVRRAAGHLGAGDALFAFPAAAQCRLKGANVESPLLADEHGHDKKHTEFHVLYRFQCARPASLTYLDATKFFERFPAAREIEAQAVTPRGQRAGELTPSMPKLTF